MPKQKTEIRKTERTLKWNFTDAEVLQIGRELAEKTSLASQLEAEKKRFVKDFDAKIAEADAQIQQASSKVQSGYEYRIVKCEETIGEPNENKKTVRRMDTGEVVEVRDLNNEEKQRLLDLNEPEQKDAKQPAAK